jgi:hypothetical protein
MIELAAVAGFVEAVGAGAGRAEPATLEHALAVAITIMPATMLTNILFLTLAMPGRLAVGGKGVGRLITSRAACASPSRVVRSNRRPVKCTSGPSVQAR